MLCDVELRPEHRLVNAHLPSLRKLDLAYIDCTRGGLPLSLFISATGLTSMDLEEKGDSQQVLSVLSEMSGLRQLRELQLGHYRSRLEQRSLAALQPLPALRLRRAVQLPAGLAAGRQLAEGANLSGHLWQQIWLGAAIYRLVVVLLMHAICSTRPPPVPSS